MDELFITVMLGITPTSQSFPYLSLSLFKSLSPQGKNHLKNGLGLTQNSENTNSNFVLRSGNLSPPDAMLEKQLDPVVPVT